MHQNAALGKALAHVLSCAIISLGLAFETFWCVDLVCVHLFLLSKMPPKAGRRRFTGDAPSICTGRCLIPK